MNEGSGWGHEPTGNMKEHSGLPGFQQQDKDISVVIGYVLLC